MIYTPFHGKRTLSTSCLSQGKMIGQTRPRAYQTTPRAANWTITSTKMNAAARTTMTAAAERTKMTSPKMKYGRDRPVAEESRSRRMKRHVGQKFKMTSLMI